MRRQIVMLLTLLTLLLAPLAAHAQAKLDPAAKKKAAAHYKQGKAHMDAGSYDRAVEEYLASYEISKAPALLFNIGLAYHKGGKYKLAIEYLKKFLESDPQDEAIADEARELLVEAQKKLDAETAEAERQKKAREAEEKKQQAEAEAQKKREQADAHVKQAGAYLEAGQHADAAKEYKAAFEVGGDAENLFLAAEAARAGGDLEGARELYRQYLIAAPSGAHGDESRKQVALLTKQIDERKLEVKKDPGGGGTGLPGAPVKAAKKEGTQWGWLAIGVALIGAGVVADLVPESGHNGEWDGTDFVPLGIYGLGGAAVWVGVF